MAFHGALLRFLFSYPGVFHYQHQKGILLGTVRRHERKGHGTAQKDGNGLPKIAEVVGLAGAGGIRDVFPDDISSE